MYPANTGYLKMLIALLCLFFLLGHYILAGFKGWHKKLWKVGPQIQDGDILYAIKIE